MTQTHYTSRSMVQLHQRCRRARWLANYEGAAGVGLEPRRKSIHLVVGSAVHAGLGTLLRDGQEFYDKWMANFSDYPNAATEVWEQQPQWREIEDQAVAAALVDFAKEFGDGGVELDPEEAAAGAGGGQDGAGNLVQITGLDILKGQLRWSLQQEDSPIVIEFGDFGDFGGGMQVGVDMAAPGMDVTVVATMTVRPPQQTATEYLREELSSLIEGMVRAWSRRRWRQLLTDFEVLEIEREGAWKLADIDLDPNPDCPLCLGRGAHAITGMTTDWGRSQSVMCECTKGALHFQSRHDALLLERSTGYLYLQSFKTTGTWDRRKELDAQVDMQGLSEGVDVERRFEEAWKLLKDQLTEDLPEDLDRSQKAWLAENVSLRVQQWLSEQPDPPRILGVRYEYLLKGMRKRDKKDATNPDRYVQESILCRAWKQEGITSEDRRWAWTYDWQDQTGKGRRLPWQSWQKAAVWKQMTVADWVDKLDRGEVQPDALDERGEVMDALGSQFVPVIVVYRNQDEALDLLEQLEAQEVEVVKAVAAVREAEAREGYVGKRSALNKYFGQTRTACSYPGLCEFRSTPTKPGFCFGSADPYRESAVLEHFKERVPNHPVEGGAE